MKGYILKKKEIDTMQGSYKTHYLNEDAARTKKSLGDLTGLQGFGFHMIEVPVGKASTEFHFHKHEDECVYILEGQADAVIGEDTYPVSAGDFIGYRANGLPHLLQNTGTTPLKCIVVGTRLPHDVADYPRLNKRLYRNQGQEWELVDIDKVTYPKSSTPSTQNEKAS